MKASQAVAIVGVGAILPDAFSVPAFWDNLIQKKYSIQEVPPDRWNPALYYDPDPAAVDKTYSKIGAFVQGYQFDPMKLGFPIPPRVLAVMDDAQKWAIAAVKQVLDDYGYPARALDPERVAVIFGNAMGGEYNIRTNIRILLPEYESVLQQLPEFAGLPPAVQAALMDGFRRGVRERIPAITEDTMPGELANVIAGRVANVFNFSGPNFITDAACASSLAAVQAAVEGLLDNKFDAVLTGGVDRSNGPEGFVKFSKIGALSPDGSRPYADGANGFVMGEGAAVFLLKRLADAERDGDRVYAVIRGIGGSSDGKGKGITAPNPLGQQRAIIRAWQDAGISPQSVGLIEGHGTSTRVGDVAEVSSLDAVFKEFSLPAGSIALGSVKSNIGHLKSAAGAAGLLKAVLALHHKMLPPSLNFDRPNPNIPFGSIPFYVNTAATPWEVNQGQIRRAGVSSFGFGGTNFHIVLEEYRPGELTAEPQQVFTAARSTPPTAAAAPAPSPAPAAVSAPAPAAAVSASENDVMGFILSAVSEKTGYPVEMLDPDLDLEADLGIDTVKQAELFAAVRTHYNIPRRDDLRLADYNTLRKVAGFMLEALGPSGSAPAQAGAENQPPAAVQSAAPAGGPSREAVTSFVLAAVSEKTGYPVEMLDMDLDLEADLGIDTVKQAELFAAIRTHYNIPRREDLRLADYNTLSKVVGFMEEALGAAAAGAPGQTSSTPAAAATAAPISSPASSSALVPYQGLLFLSAGSKADLRAALAKKVEELRAGGVHVPALPTPEALALPERVVIDYADSAELLKRAERALSAFDTDTPAGWQAMMAHGVYRGSGRAGKLVYLFPGQGSQYVNMIKDLRQYEPVVVDTFDEADRILEPILGRPLTSFIYVEGGEEELAQAEKNLKDTTITQPAMLTANVALLRVLDKFGFKPDLVIGHSLGEYAALVAAGVLTFAEALEVVSARGQEMKKVSMADNGCMAAVSAPLGEVEKILAGLSGYVVLANINSPLQSVIGGDTPSVDAAIAAFPAAGFQAVKIPVSHAFHTKIVAPASEPLRRVIERMNIQPPRIPIVANVTGELYPQTRAEILDILTRQVASPVQFVKGMQTLYREGGRVFIEVGPKRVLNALATDNLKDKPDVILLASNHPRKGGRASINEALCGLFAAGVGAASQDPVILTDAVPPAQPVVEVLSETAAPLSAGGLSGSVVITGAGLGLPGSRHAVFEDYNIQRLLDGEMMIEPLPEKARKRMLQKKVTRLVKSEAGAVMEPIDSLDQVLSLAGQRGAFDLAADFGVPEERVETLDISTQLAMGAGIEALRDAGIPLVMNYRQTSRGTYLPNRWMLPPALQDETGVIFCSAFPGLDRMSDEADRYYTHRSLEKQQRELASLRKELSGLDPASRKQVESVLDRRAKELEKALKDLNYQFDRRYVFRILAMGHSQFAEYIGARGPNTHVNAACATTTHAVAIAEDWIRAGRCRRVVIVAGDDVTNPNLIQWIGTSMFASGAATTEANLRMAALPFDRRRNGMIMGMGAAALVVEAEDAARERGVRAICELLSSQIANSAYHGTRLDVAHVSSVMRRLLAVAEARFGLRPAQIAAQTVFVSHETYTPARGGSAAAEIHALRDCFGDFASRVIIANTKGFTGHTMGVGVEDVLAVKALEFGRVPPIAFIHDGFEPDPDLGDLNLSRGGPAEIQFALRLGAGFGSQIAMTLLRRVPGEGQRIDQPTYRRWLAVAAGYPQAELEVVQRTLRVKDQGAPTLQPLASSWEYGQGPRAWADAPRLVELPAASLPASPPAQKPAPEQPAVTPPRAPALQPADADEIGPYVLNAVSEKTGYPPEMLDLDLDLEADLGIDTVKQAELFAQIRTHYGIPRREDLRLADYNTLRKVIGFMKDAVSAAAPALSEAAAPEQQPQKAQPQPQRRVVRPVLRPKLELCLPTGIELDEKSRVVVVKDSGKIAPALVKALKSRGCQVLAVNPGEAAEKAAAWNQQGAVQGVFYLAALDSEPDFFSLSPQDWRELLAGRLEPLFHLMRALPENAFLVSATRLGGLNGLEAYPEPNPVGGAVGGFTKALGMERGGAFVKVVDFEKEIDPARAAQSLVSETLADPAVREVGWKNDLRFSPTLLERDFDTREAKIAQGAVVVISGGAGGITAPIIKELGAALKARFFLLGRSPLPASDDPDLALLRQDRAALRQEWMERLSAQGEKPTPAQIESKLAAFERAAGALEAMEAVRQAGGQAEYLVCDLNDPAAVKSALAKVKKSARRVDVLIHAAGVDKSRKLDGKTLEEFRQVVAVKAEGIHNLVSALKEQALTPRAVVLFSSVAGRFGNSGQTDYAAANDFLSKLAFLLPAGFPGARCISVDWGAWAEVGMASRGSIPRLMAYAGIEMLPPAVGAAMLRDELLYGEGGEVVLAGSLGLLEASRHPAHGLDVARADAALRSGTPSHTMFSHLTGMDPCGEILLEAILDPNEQAFLKDHSLNGVPILPGVIGIEGFAVAARHIASALAAQSGRFEIDRLEAVNFHAPFKFYRNQPRSILWRANAVQESAGLVVHVRLESEQTLLDQRVEHTVHFTGRAVLTNALPAAPRSAVPRWGKRSTVNADEIYRLYFHGPSFQVLEAAQRSGKVILGRMNRETGRAKTGKTDRYSVPMLVELCFQTAGIWEVGASGVLALPRSIGSLRVYRSEINGKQIYAEVLPQQAEDGLYFDCRVVDEDGSVYLEMNAYRTAPIPYPADAELAAPFKRLVDEG